MEWIHQFDLFLFDFDGLLVNTEALHFKAYHEMCLQRGYSLVWSFDDYITMAHRDALGVRTELYRLFPRMFEEASSWEILYSEKKKIYEALLTTAEIALLPGVEELLLELARHEKKRCVVTNSPRVQIEWIKSRNAVLQTIPHWFCRESYDRAKPAPDGYLKALKQLKAAGDRVVGFEDSWRGLEALKEAGVETPILICEPSHPQLMKAPQLKQYFRVSIVNPM